MHLVFVVVRRISNHDQWSINIDFDARMKRKRRNHVALIVYFLCISHQIGPSCMLDISFL